MISDKNTINEHLSKAEILSRLFSIWNPSVRTETVPLQEAYGRVLAEDQRAQFDLPVVRASSMDGIAVRSADFLDGMPDTSGWKAGREFVRADTGDDFDDAYDSVIRIEDVRIGDDGSLTLCLPEGTVPEPGMNVRPAGSMLKKGVLLAESGHTITAMDLAALESGGITSVPVVKKPVVGFIPTGSELTAPGNIPQRGQNIDCNSTLAKYMILEMGGEPVCYPIVRDKKEDLKDIVERALAECDIVLINGGSSKGEEDFNAEIILGRGTAVSHWVKAAPGRPMGVAVADGKPLINLSGPTAAAFYGLEWCVRPVMARALGIRVSSRQSVSAVLTEDLEAPGVIEFLCMINLFRDGEGILRAVPARNRMNGNPPLAADAMLVTELEKTLYRKDEAVDVLLLRPLNEI